MSRAMALQVAADEGFRSFYRVAQQRNTAGTPCKHFSKCASQPPDVHMWHHEDAGVGFNVFRAAVAANATATFVPVPAHYNDPGVIERSAETRTPSASRPLARARSTTRRTVRRQSGPSPPVGGRGSL